MYNIYFAIGHSDLENFIKSNKATIEKYKKTQVAFVGETTYREGILDGVKETKPDVVIIREGLNGNVNITEVLYELLVSCPKTRIIFLAGERNQGDALLATLVRYGIYDLIVGSKLKAVDIIKKIVVPSKFADVAYLVPKEFVDEKSNKQLFEVPNSPNNPNNTNGNIIVEESIENSELNDDLVEDSSNEEITETNNIEELNTNKSSILPLRINLKNNIKLDMGKKNIEEDTPKEKSVPQLKITKDKNKIKNTPTEKEVIKQTTIPKYAEVNGSQQIITFMGGRSGVGNSHVAFNTALKLAELGHKTIYIDVNDRFSAIDKTFELGYKDVGLDTALIGIQKEDYPLISRSIATINKILNNTDKNNMLYKTYKRLPQTLDFLFFSENYMKRMEDDLEINHNSLKDLNLFLLMQEGYKYIVYDVPSNIYNKYTETALIYSSKIFITLNPDVSATSSILSQMMVLDEKRIKYKDKMYYVLNKYDAAKFTVKECKELFNDTLKLKELGIKLEITTIPNLNKEFINSNYDGIPILFNCKNKDLQKGFAVIEKNILNN